MGSRYYSSATNYKANLVSAGVAYQGGCCDDTGPVGPMPLSKYCDAIDPCNPDPCVVTAIIEDMSCLCHKLVGDNRNYKADCMMFECEMQKLREELECCLKAKNELEELLIAQEAELKDTQLELDEISQSRMELDGAASLMKQQLGQSDEDLLLESQEKLRMQECIDELEAQLLSCCEALQRLELEKQELFRNCDSHQEDYLLKEHEIIGLRDALDKCYAEIDCLQQCIEKLKAEINRLNRENRDLLCEKDHLLLDLECGKAKDCREKSFLEETVESLKCQLECLLVEKNEVCRKCNEIVQLHHAEIDSLRTEVQNLRGLDNDGKKALEALEKKLRDCEEDKARKMRLYEDEKRAREDLERKLKHCEEDKAQRMQQPVYTPPQSEYDQSLISRLHSDCESHRTTIRTLHQERLSHRGGMQRLEQQVEDVEAENLKLQNQLRELQLKVANKATKAKRVYFSNAEQRHGHEDSQNTESDLLEDIENANVQLQTDLQKTETEKSAYQYENDNLKTTLQKANTEKLMFEKQIEQLHQQLQVTEVYKVQFENDKQKFEERLRWAEDIKTTLEEDRKQLLFELEKKEAEAVRQQILIDSNQRNLAKLEEFSSTPVVVVNEQHEVDLDELKADYESKLEQIKSRCKLEAEAHFRQKLERAQTRFEKENDNRPVPEDPNGNKVITDLTAINKSLKQDIKKLKKMVNERDEHIIALQEGINEIKKKYSEQHKEVRLQKIKLHGLQTDLERQEAHSLKESEELARENIRISRERKNVENEKLKLQEEIRVAEKEKITLETLAKMKDRIESEVGRLKEAISQQLIDRSELEKVQAEYETKLSEVKDQFDAQLEMNRQLAEINEYLGKQSQDRALIDKIRDSNENLLRKELNSVSISLKLDTEKLRNLIKERDEEIISLRKAVGVLKTKYATESQNREELIKKVQILSTASQESLEVENVDDGHQTAETEE